MVWWAALGCSIVPSAGAGGLLLSVSMGVGAGESPRWDKSSATALITAVGNPMLLFVDLSGRFSCMECAGVPKVRGAHCLLGVERGARRSTLVRGGFVWVG